jgi:hypothetical protein
MPTSTNRSWNETIEYKWLKKIIDTISGRQDNNLKKVGRELASLTEFEKMSNELGFWRLLIMGIIAIALFAATVVLIFFTSFFR